MRASLAAVRWALYASVRKLREILEFVSKVTMRPGIGNAEMVSLKCFYLFLDGRAMLKKVINFLCVYLVYFYI